MAGSAIRAAGSRPKTHEILAPPSCGNSGAKAAVIF
jgi:hypothetical protein